MAKLQKIFPSTKFYHICNPVSAILQSCVQSWGGKPLIPQRWLPYHQFHEKLIFAKSSSRFCIFFAFFPLPSL